MDTFNPAATTDPAHFATDSFAVGPMDAHADAATINHGFVPMDAHPDAATTTAGFLPMDAPAPAAKMDDWLTCFEQYTNLGNGSTDSVTPHTDATADAATTTTAGFLPVDALAPAAKMDDWLTCFEQLTNLGNGSTDSVTPYTDATADAATTTTTGFVPMEASVDAAATNHGFVPTDAAAPSATIDPAFFGTDFFPVGLMGTFTLAATCQRVSACRFRAGRASRVVEHLFVLVCSIHTFTHVLTVIPPSTRPSSKHRLIDT